MAQKGPIKVTHGLNFKVHVQIQNNLEGKITDVKAVSQFFVHDFGEIDANRTLMTSYEAVLPSIETLKKDFGENVKLSDVFHLGKITLNYVYNGESFTVYSNELNLSIC